MFNTKKKHFKRKLKNLDKTIWDLEFKKQQAGVLREKIRLDRDNKLNHRNMVEAKLKLEENKNEELEKALTEANDTLTRFEAQLKMIDEQIQGGTPTPEDPSGEGVMGQIARLHELRIMLTNYIKTL